jgi:hypothetical protein
MPCFSISCAIAASRARIRAERRRLEGKGLIFFARDEIARLVHQPLERLAGGFEKSRRENDPADEIGGLGLQEIIGAAAAAVARQRQCRDHGFERPFVEQPHMA